MQTAELSRESRDLGTFLRLSFEPFMTFGKSQCFYSLPLSLGGLTRPSHRTNFLHSAGQARKGPRGAIGPKQGHGPQKGPARCAAVSQRQAAHGGALPPWEEKQLEKRGARPSPGPVPRDPSSRPCFISTLLGSLFSVNSRVPDSQQESESPFKDSSYRHSAPQAPFDIYYVWGRLLDTVY